jgi:hypothetical protein
MRSAPTTLEAIMPGMSDSWKSSDRILQIIILVAVLLVGATLGTGGWALISSTTATRGAPEIVLPLLTIGGLLSLLIVLALMSVFFQTLGLSNKEQALALPEGSVRAVIALGLIVLFAILSIYLYASLRVEPKASEVGVDFAKQVITIVGTLVTAVASFYFGANTVASAQKAAKEGTEAPAPTVRGISPNTLPPGGSESFTVTGDNLNPITHVRLERDGSAPINVDAVHSNAHSVTGKITIPGDDKALGKWSVVVSDDTGKIRAELKDGFEVKKS